MNSYAHVLFGLYKLWLQANIIPLFVFSRIILSPTNCKHMHIKEKQNLQFYAHNYV